MRTQTNLASPRPAPKASDALLLPSRQNVSGSDCGSVAFDLSPRNRGNAQSSLAFSDIAAIALRISKVLAQKQAVKNSPESGPFRKG
jgi:hypothetical protein